MNSRNQPIKIGGGWLMHLHHQSGFVFRHPALPDSPPYVLDYISRIDDYFVVG